MYLIGSKFFPKKHIAKSMQFEFVFKYTVRTVHPVLNCFDLIFSIVTNSYIHGTTHLAIGYYTWVSNSTLLKRSGKMKKINHTI